MDVCEYSARFPATADGIRAARHYAVAVAVLSPRRHDIQLVAGELALSAVRGSADGEFTLTAARHRFRGWLRMEASHTTGTWSGGDDAELAYSYGLMIVDSLASRWGSDGARDADRPSAGTATIWAELS